jgi:glycosyltransferase involved in cell wall biosynthesis
VSSALLVSLSAPELDRLAVELATRESLVGLVRRYANKRRWWERQLGNTPLIGSLYASTLGRRLPPLGLRSSLVIEAGVATDFAAAVVSRVGRGHPDLVTRVNRQLIGHTEKSIAQAARRHVSRADVVVASYHVALAPFRRAKELGRRTVLNYPIAHHRWQYSYYAQLAVRYPQFAAALPQFGSLEAHARTLDQEIELADQILVGSQFVRDTFINVGIAPERLRVIPYGADSQRFKPDAVARTVTDPFRALFVGQIGERKGISHLLQGYKAFRRPDTELHLVGDYAPGSEVYRPYRDLYRHTPNVPQTQLPALMRSADVFVFPSLVEGMPMVVLEAMACGIPVIVTANGPGDVVRDGVDGYVVPTCDGAAIAQRLQCLYEDRDLRLQMGRNARQQAEQWSWARYARRAADAVLKLQHCSDM